VVIKVVFWLILNILKYLDLHFAFGPTKY